MVVRTIEDSVHSHSQPPNRKRNCRNVQSTCTILLYTTKTSDLVRSCRRGHDLCHTIGGGVRGEVWGTEARELLWLVRVRLGSG